MTVAEFIKVLEKYPQDYELIIEDCRLYDDPEQFDVDHPSKEVVYYPSY